MMIHTHPHNSASIYYGIRVQNQYPTCTSMYVEPRMDIFMIFMVLFFSLQEEGEKEVNYYSFILKYYTYIIAYNYTCM